MEVHKRYWINVLRSLEDKREVKRQFIKDLGCMDAEEALDYLETCEQTTFVGSWFLTDEELAEERERNATGKLSVFMDTDSKGVIRLFSEKLSSRMEELEQNCGGLMKLLVELSKHTPEDHKRIVESLTTLVSWSSELSKSGDRLSDRGQTAYILLDLIENNAEDRVNLLVLFQLTQIFVDYMEGSIWATGRGFSNPNIIGDA